MPHHFRLSLLGLLLSLGLSPSLSAQGLTVVVDNLGHAEGEIKIALFDQAEAYMETPLRAASLPADPSGTVQLVWADLPTGTYAISVYHDENSNDELDANFLGIPREPYGFSNRAKATMGPPSFDKASFRFDGKAHRETITLTD